jgi:hypothetical protein
LSRAFSKDLELELMVIDMSVWPVQTAPLGKDGPRETFQIRRRLLTAQRGAWSVAADLTPVWIGFGQAWRDGDEPLPWAAHAALWRTFDGYGDHVRFHRRLGGVRRLTLTRGLL